MDPTPLLSLRGVLGAPLPGMTGRPRRAYRHLQRRENKVFKELGEGLGEILESRLLAPTA